MVNADEKKPALSHHNKEKKVLAEKNGKNNPMDMIEIKGERQIEEEKLQADDETGRAVLSESDAKADRPDKTQSIFAGINAGFNVTFPSGEVVSMSSQKIRPGCDYSIGAIAGWLLFSIGGPVFEIEYARKSVSIERTYIYYPVKNMYDFYFMDLSPGFRFIIKYFYAEAGIFWGVKLGGWRASEDIMGFITSRKFNKYRHNELGGHLGLGLSLPVYKVLHLDFTIRFKGSFLYAYDKNDRLRTNQVGFLAGASYYL